MVRLPGTAIGGAHLLLLTGPAADGQKVTISRTIIVGRVRTMNNTTSVFAAALLIVVALLVATAAAHRARRQPSDLVP